MAGQSNPYTPITFSAVLPLKNGIFTVNMHTIKWGWAYLRKKITVNMPPLKSSLIKPSKSMLFFHIWNANFSVTPINSQMYMTKPKQVQKNAQKILGNFFRNYALFYMQGVGIFTEITVIPFLGIILMLNWVHVWKSKMWNLCCDPCLIWEVVISWEQWSLFLQLNKTPWQN